MLLISQFPSSEFAMYPLLGVIAIDFLQISENLLQVLLFALCILPYMAKRTIEGSIPLSLP